jgi:hypothetical protein
LQRREGLRNKNPGFAGRSPRQGRNWVASGDHLGRSEEAVVAAACGPIDRAVQRPNCRAAGVVPFGARDGCNRLRWCSVECVASCVSQLCTSARLRPRRYWGLEEPVRMSLGGGAEAGHAGMGDRGLRDV